MKVLKYIKSLIRENWVVLSMVVGMSVLYGIMYGFIPSVIFYILISSVLLFLIEIGNKYN